MHLEVTKIEVDCKALFTPDQMQALLLLTAGSGAEAAEKIGLLVVVGIQNFSSTTGSDS